MSIGILIITHNAIGREILSTANDIFGQLAIKADFISISPNADYDKKLAQARQSINTLDMGDGVLVLTDIFGATPCNIAIKAAEDVNARVIAGINLPMVVRILNYAELSLDEIVTKTVDAGHSSIVLCDKKPTGQ